MADVSEDRRVKRSRKLLKQGFMDLLREKGFARISVRDITDRADMNRGTFYLHYPDTAALMRSVEEDMLQEAQTLIDAHLQEAMNGNSLRPLFEPVLWFQKPYKIGGTIADNVLEYGVGAWNEEALRKYNNQAEAAAVFSNLIKVETESADHGKHVAQKPLKLMELLISLVTLEGQTVLDPFMGSGTTCLAAQRLHRRYIGIDMNPQNVEIAKARLSPYCLERR